MAISLTGQAAWPHGALDAGSLAVASLVARAASGTLNLATALDDTVALIGPCRVADNLLLAQRLLATDLSTADALVEIGTTGWIVHTVAAAVYCFLKTPTDFERSIIDAVMGGYDADTTAAITGAISGAYNGEASIPRRWRTQVENADEIRALAQALWQLQAN